MQFKAGYILDSIAKVINDQRNCLHHENVSDREQLGQINGLLQHVSSFEVDFPEYNVDFLTLNPVLAVLNNIITRGLPTRAPVMIEKIFVQIGLIAPNTDENSLKYNDFMNESDTSTTRKERCNDIFELLHIIEPGLNIAKADYAGALDSHLEWEFIGKHPFLKQIIEPQRNFSTINNQVKGDRTVDFCFTSPYLHYNLQTRQHENISRIFEVDGPHHQFSEYRYYDDRRDELAGEFNFETRRYNTQIIQENRIDFTTLLSRRQYEIFEKNFNCNIDNNLGLYTLIYVPMSVARIQKTLLECFIIDQTLLSRKILNIAIVERDLPCGAIAIQSLKDLFYNLNSILEERDQLILPEIKLSIFQNKKWVINEKLHLGAELMDEHFFNANSFDIIIDHSILRRSKIYKERDFVSQSHNTVAIRSSHYFDNSFENSRRIYCANPLSYKQLVRKNKDDGAYDPIETLKDNINYFIQNIFRKSGFRPGQLPIISRALQQKPVIGLLPTGGGKSLAYQLPAFLQPGLCLVVDPIKSLMEDQVRVLNENWLDSCAFINSNLNREDKAKRLIDFRYGESMFLFVSPERLVMQEFRDIIQNIGSNSLGLTFAYCVIDEVHCVSEWGHDFRTTYLMLGNNAQKFAHTRNGRSVSLIGLTATASFDVLTDIERELHINSEEVNDAVISIDNTIRPELFFTVVENETKVTNFPILAQSLKDAIGFVKQAKINEYIQSIVEKINSIGEDVVDKCLEQHFADFELNVSLGDTGENEQILTAKNNIIADLNLKTFDDVVSVIFCPHTTGTLGITQEANLHPNNKELFENLIVPLSNKGYFMGGDDKTRREVIENAQRYFLEFMQGRINYMICTKAFGMGIDKEHIRSVYHINFSSSPESYIQEAGRAGRDKAKSVCTIFLDRNVYYTVHNNFIIKNNPQKFPLLADRQTARELFETYNDFQNRLSEKYYGSVKSLKQKFIEIGVDLEDEYILPFNQDLAVHEYFHNNSFKGIETEVFQIDRLLNYKEGINTTQLKISQDKYNFEYDDNINLKLTTAGQWQGNMLINNAAGFAIGKLFSNSPTPSATVNGLPTRREPDYVKSKQVLKFLVDEWQNQGVTQATLFEFLNQKVELGLNKGLSLVDYFEEEEEENFVFKVPASFTKHTLERDLVSDFELSNLPVFGQHTQSATYYIDTLKKFSSGFEDFILRIEEQWDKHILSHPTYNQKRNQYKEQYYSEINTADVSKMIYRLNSIGLINDYTIDYNLGIFTIHVIKKEKEYYLEQTKSHLLKYLSQTESNKRIDELVNVTKEMEVFETVKKCIKVILTFTYADIVKKRKDAVNDLFKFISDSLDQSKKKENQTLFKDYWYNYHFKDDMYYYFNAKYARVGFKIGGEPYSLLDDTEKGQVSDWKIFEKYALVLNNQSSFISECKMMRGSCRRIWRTLHSSDNEKEYVLKILAAFATFGLNNKFYYQEAEDFLIEGFIIFYNQHASYSQLKTKISSFEQLLLKSTSNKDYIPYLNTAKHKIMLIVNRKYAKSITQQLENI